MILGALSSSGDLCRQVTALPAQHDGQLAVGRSWTLCVTCHRHAGSRSPADGGERQFPQRLLVAARPQMSHHVPDVQHDKTPAKLNNRTVVFGPCRRWIDGATRPDSSQQRNRRIDTPAKLPGTGFGKCQELLGGRRRHLHLPSPAFDRRSQRPGSGADTRASTTPREPGRVNRRKISRGCRSMPLRHALGRWVRPDPADEPRTNDQKARPPSPAIRP